MSDDATRLRAWQVKDFPEDKRQAVIRAAAGAGQTVAQWLEPVIEAGLTGAVNPLEAPPRRLAAEALIAIASNPGIPRWLRREANRQLGALLGAVPPAPPKRLEGPQHDTARARQTATPPAAPADSAQGQAAGMAE